MSADLTERLRGSRNADGGWGSVEGGPSVTEVTALALMAVSGTPGSDGDGAAAARWLLERQRADGAWPLNDLVPGPSWTTPLAVLALDGRADAGRAIRSALDWILATSGISTPWRERFREWLSGEQIVELDPTLAGWPWSPGTFSWIEPTSYALLALKRHYGDRPPRRVRSRIREAEAMIRDRACPGGGWNYGNSRVLGADLEPFPDTTALALLALQDARTDATAVEGMARLDRMVDAGASGLTLALTLLCRRSWGRDAGSLRPWLEARFEQTAFLGDTRSLALAALALAETPNPFLLSADA